MAKFVLLVVASLGILGCAPSAPKPRQNLDPLFYSSGGGGEYPVDPAEIERQQAAFRPRRAVPPEPPAEVKAEPCKHTWQFLNDQTHAYIDREGSPALCTPRYCTQCGMLIHECSKRGR